MLHTYRKVILFIFCFASAPAYSSSNQTRAHFLDYGPSAGASGMGEANVAYALDAGAIYYNPALMYSIRDQVTASHWFLFDGTRYDFIGVVVNGEKSAFGLAGTQLYRDNIEARQSITDPGTMVQNNQMAVYGAYAGRFSKLKLNYGASVKWLRYAMGEFSANGFSSDVGLSKNLFSRVYSMGKRVAVTGGVTATNIVQTGITMDTEKEYALKSVRAAVAFSTTLWPKYNRDQNKLTYDNLLGEVGCRFADGQKYLGGGVQFTLLQKLLLRTGYERGITAGFGYKFGDIILDYAFMMKELTNFHRIGFSYNFGEAEPTEVTMPITDDFQKTYQKALRVYDRYVRNAEELIKQERHKDARILLIKALPLNPKNNGNAKNLLKVCDQVLLTNQTKDLLAKANAAVPGDIAGAYGLYLDVYRMSADQSVLDTADEMIIKDPNLAIKKKAFTDAQIQAFNKALDEIDFDEAERQLQLLKPLVENKEFGQYSAALADRKRIRVDKLVATGMGYMQKDDLIRAYAYIKEAYRLSGDVAIQDQGEIAKDKYFAKKKYSVEDNIYADKLYYKLAYNFATDDSYRAIQGELLSFNPFYPLDEFTRSAVLLGKEAAAVYSVE